jgi:hypothetical protein
MRKQFYLVVLASISLITPSFAQFDDNLNGDVGNPDISSGGYRTGLLGIGFPDAASLRAAIGSSTLDAANPRARFTVRNGIIAHHVSDTIGNFAGKWLGLGIGNPGGPAGSPKPYGLAIADTGSVAFFNVLRENFNGVIRKNTVAGFGAEGVNANRFIIRGYSGTNAATGRDILVANANGAVGINAEPLTSFWVDSKLTNTDSVRFRDIAIVGRQTAGLSGVTTASAIGNQQNSSLAANNIAVEGFRAQFPDFLDALANLIPPGMQTGGAVNVQVVKNPLGTTDAIASVSTIAGNKEYAEITWQDLDFGDTAVVNCAVFPIADAQAVDKFFISFRNNQNANPFAAGNKLPVMTFQANGRVGIGTLQPTSGTCTPTEQRILLDVNGLINAGGTVVGSDRRFKKDIETIPNSMELIRKMRGTTYTLNTKDFPDRNFSSGKQYGFIAQEVAEVIPELALLNSDGYYAVNYTMLIPVLTEAIKEQDSTMIAQAEVISALQTELSELRSTVADLKADRAGQNTEGFRLEQNAPNPFSNSTVIGYALPSGTNGAVISVYDLTGRTLRSFNLSDGEGQITLNAGDLPEGLYIYDLQVNGRQVLERKMSVARR